MPSAFAHSQATFSLNQNHHDEHNDPPHGSQTKQPLSGIAKSLRLRRLSLVPGGKRRAQLREQGERGTLRARH